MKSRTVVPTLLLASLLLIPTDAAQFDYGPDDRIPVTASLPDAIEELYQAESRIWGSQGFLDTWAYYAGDTETLNAFLDTLAEVQKTRLTAVLHPGPRTLSAREHGPDRDLNVDWMLRVSEYLDSRSDAELFQGQPFMATVDIWLGKSIDLEHLLIPANMGLSSGREIEVFVKNHEEKRTN